MIGILLATKYVAKKNWMQSLALWGGTLIIMTILTLGLWYTLAEPQTWLWLITWYKIAFYVGVFMALTMFWPFVKMPFQKAIPTLLVALVIDFVISAVIVTYIINAGLWQDWINWLPNMGFAI